MKAAGLFVRKSLTQMPLVVSKACRTKCFRSACEASEARLTDCEFSYERSEWRSPRRTTQRIEHGLSVVLALKDAVTFQSMEQNDRSWGRRTSNLSDCNTVEFIDKSDNDDGSGASVWSEQGVGS